MAITRSKSSSPAQLFSPRRSNVTRGDHRAFLVLSAGTEQSSNHDTWFPWREGARAKRGKSHVHPGGVGQTTKVPFHHQLSAPAPVLRPHNAQETESNDRQPGQTSRPLERDSRRATFFSPRIRTDLHSGGSSSTMSRSHLQAVAKGTVDGRARSSGTSFLIPNSLRYRSHIET